MSARGDDGTTRGRRTDRRVRPSTRRSASPDDRWRTTSLVGSLRSYQHRQRGCRGTAIARRSCFRRSTRCKSRTCSRCSRTCRRPRSRGTAAPPGRSIAHCGGARPPGNLPTPSPAPPSKTWTRDLPPSSIATCGHPFPPSASLAQDAQGSCPSSRA